MGSIKCSNLQRTYSCEQYHVHAVANCNIEIEQGEFAVISGEKYSGRTTLLRLLGGYDRPSQGTVSINGVNLSLLSDDELTVLRRSEIGYLFSNDSLLPELTVHENIIMPCLIARSSYDEAYYKELADHLHILGIQARYPGQLTANQKDFVAYTRALIRKPGIILMDEPEEDFYNNTGIKILEYLMEFVRRNHNTLIMVSNHPKIVAQADHIITLKRGLVVEDILI